MERKLQLLETYSFRSQETHAYFVEDNLEQNKFHILKFTRQPGGQIV